MSLLLDDYDPALPPERQPACHDAASVPSRRQYADPACRWCAGAGETWAPHPEAHCVTLVPCSCLEEERTRWLLRELGRFRSAAELLAQRGRERRALGHQRHAVDHDRMRVAAVLGRLVEAGRVQARWGGAVGGAQVRFFARAVG